MKRPFNKRLLIFFLLLGVKVSMLQAQTCTIVNNDTIICQGTSVSFSVNTTGGTPASYAWNFGNGFTANTSAPAHTYTTPGTFTPTVVVTFVGGATCNVSGNPIRVFATPVAGFNITTSRQMCFKNNELCIQDLSVPGSSGAPIKRRVYQLSNGFLQIDVPPYSPQICYKDTTDVMGHVFSLVIEVTDTNNCVSKLMKKDSVVLYPKFEKLDYAVAVTKFCNKTRVAFTNTSDMQRARVQRFRWQFGDGAVDSVNWLSTTHDYTDTGVFAPILIVSDTQGCIDTVKPKLSVNVLFPDSAIQMIKPTTQCYSGNEFECISLNPLDFTFDWNVTDKDGIGITILQGPPNVIRFSTQVCGRFKVGLTLSLGSCTIHTDSFIDVRGPKAVMEEGKYKVTNGRQCHIRDTVFFVTPNPYLSCVYQNGLGLKHLWDFDDAFAPQCTVDTRKGINIGMNCNFSRDSNLVNHIYTPGKEKCYNPSLYMVDTILGCEDSTHAKLALMPPDASPDPNASPPRRGLYTMDSLRCIGEAVGFNYEVLPTCGYTRAFINVDSACGINNWRLADTFGTYVYVHTYNSTCSNDGYVTVGLIIVNGNEEAGNACYDTAWYHHIIRLSPINPDYTYKINTDCKPYQVTFTPNDSIQYKLSKAFWALNAGVGGVADTVSQYFGPADSVVQSHSATYLRPGVYNTYTIFTNTISCLKTSFLRIAMGDSANFRVSKSPVCLYDSVTLTADVFYFSAVYPNDRYPVNFWGMPSRAAAGKENVWWDIGDGNGFAASGETVNVKMTQPGKVTIKMLVKDSMNCYDTIVKKDIITVIAPDAHIAQINQLYYCAPQIVLFNDSSFVFDSVPFVTPSADDFIVSWRWNFGDFTLESILEDAGHNYTSNGSFQVRLIATSQAGCSDTAYTQVNIAGPTPKFDIKDTIGCEPFTVLLDNTTGQPLKSWTWYFDDPANQTLTTLNDSDVKFTYTKAGTYFLKLLGSQDVTNPSTGNTVNCNSFFPDPVTGMPVRKVIVLPTPPVGIEIADSACIGEDVLLISHSDTSYKQFMWKISNGDQIVMNKPDSVSTYSFDSSGVYRVILTGTHNSTSTCLDADTAEIRIMTVQANFEIDSSESPLFKFRNTSSSASRYIWNFGKPQAGATNEATTTDAEFYFGSDTATYKVCLMAFNALDCMDSVCHNIRISQIRLEIPNVFTPDNGDGYNDAFDIDILGFTEYHLLIYNRWGAKVFEGTQDGYKNDGINWNGNDHQTGPPCSAGTYYYIFTYKFYTESKSETAHGTITLIRDK